MKLIEALNINATPRSGSKGTFVALLACGFTPASLVSFLQAELQLACGEVKAEVRTGLYGDLIGTVHAIGQQEENAAAVLIEWSDLDSRLGVRSLGGWAPQSLPDIYDRVSTFLNHLQNAILSAPAWIPIAVSLPTLPLPPLFINAGWEANPWELAMRQSVEAFATSISDRDNIRVLSTQRLGLLSPANRRYDARMDLASGFPYTLSHASTLANLLARLLRDPQSKKGLITDLDNTLWKGILGDDGVDGISWDLDGQSQIHGLYQQLLASLADSGVLLGVASKNDQSVVEEAFGRRDIILTKRQVFPIAAGWSSKAKATTQILETWNIGPEDVVFVDDSPTEIAEMRAAHPAIECILFPGDDPDAGYELLPAIRDRFGRRTVSQEDKLRLESIRQSVSFQFEGAGDGFSDTLLATAGAKLTLDLNREAHDTRAFDLINKTNQFNLNGRRLTQTEWHAYLARDTVFLLTIEYEDRFGSLGKIAVLSGERRDSKLRIDIWVMSCRAFSRRVEHQCIRQLFDILHVDVLEFNYEPTARNGPVSNFFMHFCRQPLQSPVRVSRDEFNNNCPPLYHEIVIRKAYE